MNVLNKALASANIETNERSLWVFVGPLTGDILNMGTLEKTGDFDFEVLRYVVYLAELFPDQVHTVLWPVIPPKC